MRIDPSYRFLIYCASHPFCFLRDLPHSLPESDVPEDFGSTPSTESGLGGGTYDDPYDDPGYDYDEPLFDIPIVIYPTESPSKPFRTENEYETDVSTFPIAARFR